LHRHAGPEVAAAPQELRYRLPASVVYRPFPEETVVLNLDTGRYHGLNATAGEMLELVAKLGTVAGVAAAISQRYGIDLESAEADVSALCDRLVARGLLEQAA
jgi:hypothetical protein